MDQPLIDLKAISNAIAKLLKDETGIPWIQENQHAPRTPDRPYGTVALVLNPRLGQTEATPTEDVIGTITAVDQGLKQFTLTGDLTQKILRKGLAIVKGSTGNDGGYTVAAVGLLAGDTVVTVEEAIPDATVDGTLSVGFREICERRTMTVGLEIYGCDDPDRTNEPMEIAQQVSALLEDSDEARAALEPLGMAYENELALQDTSVELEQLTEIRAMLDLTYKVSSTRGQNVSIIESAELEETYLDPTGSVAYEDSFTVTL